MKYLKITPSGCKDISYYRYYAVVGDYINIKKMTFDFNFDLYQAFKQHGSQKHGTKEKLSIK